MTQRDPQPAAVSQRIDKWLWYTRVVKSRTLAASLVAAGKVRINRERIEKPGTQVKPDDVVTLAVHDTVRILKVCAAGVRRGPATEAQTLYEDLTPKPEPKDSTADAKDVSGRDRGSGRPTKRDRRAIDRLQGEN